MKLRRIAAALLAAFTLLGLIAPASSGAPAGPHLSLRAAAAHVDVMSYGDRVYLDLGVYLQSLDAPFEIRVARDYYTSPIEASQVLNPGATRPIPTEYLVPGFGGLADAIALQIYRGDELLKERTVDWCPGGWDMQRVNDDGPREVTYPYGCWSNPFMRSTVWGIDEGWAAAVMSGGAMRLDDGDYTARVSMTEAYQALFEIAPEDASADVDITVSSVDGGCIECPNARTSVVDGDGSLTRAPLQPDPDPDTISDLVALPAYGISVQRYLRHDWLTFGADVWNRGPAPLVVEGFRQEDADLMDAYQYFTLDGEVVGRAPVGAFEYDPHDGHQHWHFLQFARYRLLSEDKVSIVKSRKQAFCLAPTDAIHLLLPTATWRPDEMGFSRCGGPTSLWIREVLPVGWGDTYYQGLFGQGFEITDLPNGTYYIEVTANPTGLLFDRRTDNDTRLRRVILKGTPGDRVVIVPAWQGIDSEGTGF